MFWESVNAIQARQSPFVWSNLNCFQHKLSIRQLEANQAERILHTRRGRGIAAKDYSLGTGKSSDTRQMWLKLKHAVLQGFMDLLNRADNVVGIGPSLWGVTVNGNRFAVLTVKMITRQLMVTSCQRKWKEMWLLNFINDVMI